MRATTIKGLMILGLAMLTEPSIAGATVQVCNDPAPIHSDPIHVFPEFSADTDNPQLARAWVDVEVQGDYVNADLWREEGHIKKKIKGLSMDPKTKNIVFVAADGAKQVTCAVFEKGGTFSRDSFRQTEHCKFTVRTEGGNIDDGFKVKKKPFVIVDLAVD